MFQKNRNLGDKRLRDNKEDSTPNGRSTREAKVQASETRPEDQSCPNQQAGDGSGRKQQPKATTTKGDKTVRQGGSDGFWPREILRLFQNQSRSH